MLGTEPQVIEEYVDSGQVKIVFWPMLDHGRPSLDSVAAAQCLGLQNPDLYWTAHDVFFENQSQLWNAGRDWYVDTAVALGADQSAFESCFDGGEAHAFVTQLDEARRRQGIRQRPTFDLNGFLFFGNVPFNVFESYIEDALN